MLVFVQNTGVFSTIVTLSSRQIILLSRIKGWESVVMVTRCSLASLWHSATNVRRLLMDQPRVAYSLSRSHATLSLSLSLCLSLSPWCKSITSRARRRDVAVPLRGQIATVMTRTHTHTHTGGGRGPGKEDLWRAIILSIGTTAALNVPRATRISVRLLQVLKATYLLTAWRNDRTSDTRSKGRKFDSRSGRYHMVTTRTGDCLRTGKPSRYNTNTKINSAFHPSGIGKSTTGLLGCCRSIVAKNSAQGSTDCVGWQVTLRSSGMGFP